MKREPPCAFIQWKGTDVCCDIECVCGSHLHFDGYFMYFVQCPHCKRVFETEVHIGLHEIELELLEDRSSLVQIPEGDDES